MQSNKPRIEATHYIEVWSNSIRTNYTPIPARIEILEENIAITQRFAPVLSTVAVFLIKFKTPRLC